MNSERKSEIVRDVIEDYIRLSWCDEIQPSIHFRPEAIAILVKYREYSGKEACEDLLRIQSRLSYDDDDCKDDDEKIPASNRIVVTRSLTKERKCWNVIDLANVADAKTFSPGQLKLIHRHVQALQNPHMPCYTRLKSKALCESLNTCRFHEWSFLNALFGREAGQYGQDQECVLSITNKNEDDETLQQIAADVEYMKLDRILFEKESKSMPVLDWRLLQADREILAEGLYEKVKTLSRKELTRIIRDHKISKQNDVWAQLIAFLAQMNGIVLPREFFVYVARKLLSGSFRHVVERNLDAIYAFVNLVLYLYSMTASWMVWFVFFPAGRKLLQELLTDPRYLLVFLVSLSATSIPVSDIFQFLEKYGLSIPWESVRSHLTSAIPNVVESGLQQVGSTLYGGKNSGQQRWDNFVAFVTEWSEPDSWSHVCWIFDHYIDRSGLVRISDPYWKSHFASLPKYRESSLQYYDSHGTLSIVKPGEWTFLFHDEFVNEDNKLLWDQYQLRYDHPTARQAALSGIERYLLHVSIYSTSMAEWKKNSAQWWIYLADLAIILNRLKPQLGKKLQDEVISKGPGMDYSAYETAIKSVFVVQ